MTTADTPAEKAREHAEACLRTAGDTSHVSIGRTHLEALLAALTASPAQGEWISVPREPTEAMLDAGMGIDIPTKCAECVSILPYGSDVKNIWSAMFAAAPVAPSSGEWIEREAAARIVEAYIQPGLATDHENRCFTDIASAIRALELPSTPKPQELAGER